MGRKKIKELSQVDCHRICSRSHCETCPIFGICGDNEYNFMYLRDDNYLNTEVEVPD